MAKYEAELRGNFEEILNDIDDSVLSNSSSASVEDESVFVTDSAKCTVRIYERYSYTGGNRVSMSITLFESNGRIFLSVITSGGSQAMFFKLNTFGEEAFLDTITDTIDKYRI